MDAETEHRRYMGIRLATIAQMAATLEAGDRATRGEARGVSDVIETPSGYAVRAQALFNAVEDVEPPR